MLLSEFCEICKNTFFAEHDRATASDYSGVNSGERRIGKRKFKLWYKIWSICTNLSQKCELSKEGSPGEIWTGFRSSRSQMFFKMVFLKLSEFPLENTCVGDTFWQSCNPEDSIEKRLQWQFWRLTGIFKGVTNENRYDCLR